MESGKAKDIRRSDRNISTCCLILARGGSKGVPKKNIYPLAGKPLIGYTIEAARSSRYIEEVFVSTDDAQIAEVARSYGAKIIERPIELSGDESSSASSTLHALQSILNSRNDTFFVMLQCTSPFRNHYHIDEAIEQYLSEKANCLVSICKSQHHPYKMFFGEGENIKFLGSIADFEAPRQSLPTAYHINGAIYIRDVKHFMEDSRYVTLPFTSYIMDEIDSLDIDSLHDIQYAEFIMSQK